jgi:hypothetical protein
VTRDLPCETDLVSESGYLSIRDTQTVGSGEQLLTSLFLEVQVGSTIVVDGELFDSGAEYVCHLDDGTSKNISVIISWEGIELFRDYVLLHAGMQRRIKTRKAFLIDCHVPPWCQVFDASGKALVFPVTGTLSEFSVELEFSFCHLGKMFHHQSISPSVGVTIIDIPYGVGIIRLREVPIGRVVLIDGSEVVDEYQVPIAYGNTKVLSLRVVDTAQIEVYAKTVALEAYELKLVTVPQPMCLSVRDNTKQSGSSFLHAETFFSKNRSIVIVVFVFLALFAYSLTIQLLGLNNTPIPSGQEISNEARNFYQMPKMQHEID